jgi:type II secretory pathway component GspD/PulD (secretin)
MIENEKMEQEARVPILGRIPLLGILFRQQVRQNKNRELIVFLTPRIVSGERPYLRMKDVKKDPKPLRSTAPVDTKTLKSLR